MGAKSVDGEGGEKVGIGGAKELAKAVERRGVEHSGVLTNGLIGDALLQSLKVAAKGRECQGTSGWSVTSLDGIKVE